MKLVLIFAILLILNFSTSAQILNPNDTIRKIEVIIVTNDDYFSCTDKDVWFDIGPRAWKFNVDGNKIERGSITPRLFDLSKINSLESPSAFKDDPTITPLLVKDITQIRIEKKGLKVSETTQGVTDAPDFVPIIDILRSNSCIGASSPLNLLNLPPEFFPITPQQHLEKLNIELGQAQTLLDQQTLLTNILADKVKDLDAKITEADNLINEVTSLPDKINNLENEAFNLGIQLNPINVSIKALSISCKKSILNPIPSLRPECKKLNGLENKYNDLQNKIIQKHNEIKSFKVRLESLQLKYGLMVAQKSTSIGIKTGTLILKASADATYSTLLASVSLLQTAITEAKDFVTRILPTLPEIPQPGQWTVKKIIVNVNDVKFYEKEINKTLKKGKSSWSENIDKDGEEAFIKSLRINANDNSSGEKASAFTTYFKLMGISGWDDSLPFKNATIIGEMVNFPSKGWDSYVSLDMLVRQITINGKTYKADKEGNLFNHKRYIRAECHHVQSNGESDTRFDNFKIGKVIKISGKLRRDTDKETFFEIHPRDQNDIEEKGFIGLFWKKLN